ncbi:MAG: alcohol acetyltransferase, partial [Dorea formicigenerans]|nr:alcohol acetyltransferase [Dorea formicigenerans]
MEKGYSKWRKLDNAALAFPLVTGKDDTRVFRFYCELKEEVDPELLQQALDETMEKYPLFQAVLRKG